MATIAITGTLLSGVTGEITMPKPGLDRHIQVDASDTGTLTVGTKVKGKTIFTTQTTVAQNTIILDIIDVIEVQIAAAGGDVDYTVSPYRDS